MPLFRYEATDPNGALREGVLDAITQNELVQRLSSAGLSVKRIYLDNTPPGVKFIPPPAAAPTSAPPLHSTPTSSARPGKLPVKRVWPLKHKGQSLFFVQLSNLLRSGITPAEALNSLASRSFHSGVKEACKTMAKATAAGMPLSDAMESYPTLFQPGQCAAMRAGEQGGYMADAAFVISEQTKRTWKIGMPYYMVTAFLLGTFLTFFVAYVGKDMIGAAIGTINDASLDTKEAMASAAREAAKGRTGWIFGGLFFGSLLLWLLGFMRMSLYPRHWLAHHLPVLRKRTRGECLSIFTWHLGHLAKTGITPWNSWRMAAEAVPNLSFSRTLLKVAENSSEQTKLSALLYQTRVFPDEYASLIETGELTGSVPQALDEASKLTMEDAKTAERNIMARAGCWVMLMLFGGGLIAFLILYTSYLQSALNILPEGF